MIAPLPALPPVTRRARATDTRYLQLIRRDVAGTLTVPESRELSRLMQAKEAA
jgi:hypothetical protein